MKKQPKTATFFSEWLPLEKQDFRTLTLLAETGNFEGNLTDMCRYFSLNPQTHTRNAFRRSIDFLASRDFIQHEQNGNNHVIKAIPKGKKIEIHFEWVEKLLKHDNISEEVSWENIAKVYLWIALHDGEQFTINDIVYDVNISSSTVTAAKNVLEKDYHAYRKTYTYTVRDDEILRTGQMADRSAWWEG